DALPILLWNKAFEKIGFQNAIVVKQMPDDADWDPADTRYNTIRWFAGVGATFAIGPSRANPFTGQIYDADIGFSEGIIRSVRRQGEEFVAPVLPPSDTAPSPIPTIWCRDSQRVCNYAEGLAEQAAFGISVFEARGALTPEVEEENELKKIASRAADPLLPYSTDEDALGTYSPNAIDPLVNQFDASSDPLAYFRTRFGIVAELWTSMEASLLKPGEGYQVLRRALGRGANAYC